MLLHLQRCGLCGVGDFCLDRSNGPPVRLLDRFVERTTLTLTLKRHDNQFGASCINYTAQNFVFALYAVQRTANSQELVKYRLQAGETAKQPLTRL